jgi:hypothetical protein
MADAFSEFPCECGGTVRMAPVRELRETYHGVFIELPPNVRVPACDRCGDTFLAEGDSDRVDAAARARLHRSYVRVGLAVRDSPLAQQEP